MNIEDLANKIETIVTQTAPTVAEATLKVVVIDGGTTLLVGLGLALLGIILLVLCNKILTSIPATKDKGTDYSDKNFGAVVSFIFGFSLVIAGLVRLFNIWHWIAVFNPELALAKQIVSSVL